jgi:glucose/arabinose dehydrogenase
MRSHLSKARSRGSKTVLALASAFVCALLSINAATSAEVAASLPAGFQESVALAGLNHPSAVQFSPDGRIFVAEKSGVIKVFDDLSDPTPTTFADLRTNVYNFYITSLSPVPKSATEDLTLRIAATVRDAQTDLIKKNTKLYLDGEAILQGAFSYNQDTNSLTYTSERLSIGKHTLKVEARDPAANVAARTWSFKIIR